MHVAVERALKFVVGVMLGLVLLALALVYGLYLFGASDIPADWGPTSAVYPDSARRALWRAEGGHGEPSIDPMSPPGFVWRTIRFAHAIDDRRIHREADLAVLARVSYPHRGYRPPTMLRWHLMRVAMAIRASQWPQEKVFDTALENEHELRRAARRLYGRDVESLDDAQLHVLIVVGGSSYGTPQCHPERARRRLAAVSRWAVAAPSASESEAALAAMRPADRPCR